ncbi:MAG: hypothetical protein IT280_11485 [Ignavibacteria bacterium]|nr:hypothetical protein [Ignavibacteria bacterium]
MRLTTNFTNFHELHKIDIINQKAFNTKRSKGDDLQPIPLPSPKNCIGNPLQGKQGKEGMKIQKK